MNKALVIFSGGQDSTTCLWWAKEKFDEVECITFVYGQNHIIEVEQSKYIAHLAKVKQRIVDISFFQQLVDSALTSGGNVNETKNGLPASFVPNRNQMFITIAHAYAQKIGAQHLVTGVCHTDYSGYPDCRQLFIDVIENATNLGSNASIKIHTPLMDLTKGDTFALAQKLGVLDFIIEHSHTCYKGDHATRHEWGYGCGECPACDLRRKGFIDFNSNIR